MEIDQIKSKDLLPPLKAMESLERLEACKRARSSISQIFDWAISHGYCEYNPVQPIRKAFVVPKRKNMAAELNPKKIGEYLRAFENYGGSLEVKTQILLMPHLAVRSGELRKMKWSEIDFEKKEWRFLSTKRNVEMVVPLSRQVLNWIEVLKPLTEFTDYVMPSPNKRGQPLSNNAVLKAYRDMGITTQALTPHGWRATFKTLLREELGYSEEVTEMQLGHKVKSPNGTAYNRTQFLEVRREMMQDWSNYLQELMEAEG